jgi:hypothetical protein
VVVLCLSVAAFASHAAVINVFPIEDQSANDANLDGVWDTLSPPDQNVLLVYNGGSTYNFRVAMEFDVGQLPANAKVNSATLRVTYDGANGMPQPSMQFHGFAGDGSISLADFNLQNPIGPLFNGFGPGYTVDVTSFVQSLPTQGSDYAGFMIENVVWLQTALKSSEDADQSLWPRLTIDYELGAEPPPAVPLPAALIPGAVMGAAVLGRSRGRRR